MSSTLRLVALVASSVWLASCVHGRTLAVPRGGRVYVAPFVDETSEGAAALGLTDALKHEVFDRDPKRYAPGLDAETVVVDGTVVKLTDTPIDGGAGALGAYEVALGATALVVDGHGAVLVDLGSAEARRRYDLSADRKATELARRAALEAAMHSIAHTLVDRLDDAGRATLPREAKAAP